MRNLSFFFSFLFSIGVHGFALYFSYGQTHKLERSFRVAITPIIPNHKIDNKVLGKNAVRSTNSKQRSTQDAKSSEKVIGVTQSYLNELIKIVESHKFYPALSRKLGEVGEVGIRFTVDSSGRLLAVILESKSSFDRLNQAAVQAVKDVGLFPRFPSTLNEQKLDLALSLKYISE